MRHSPGDMDRLVLSDPASSRVDARCTIASTGNFRLASVGACAFDLWGLWSRGPGTLPRSARTSAIPARLGRRRRQPCSLRLLLPGVHIRATDRRFLFRSKLAASRSKACSNPQQAPAANRGRSEPTGAIKRANKANGTQMLADRATATVFLQLSDQNAPLRRSRPGR